MRCSFFVVALVCASSIAHAYNDATQFFAPAGVEHASTIGVSADGVYFTGAPRFTGLDCSACHANGPHRVTLRLGADDPTLFADGYQPGHVYALEVALENESAGLSWSTPTCTDPPAAGDTFSYQPCNNNSFALEIDTAFEPLAKAFCAAPPGSSCPAPDDAADEVVVAPGGDAVFANHGRAESMPYQLLQNDPTQWHVWWTAPPAGTGPLSFYVAAVDGNGGAGTADDEQDPAGDDTVHAVVSLTERGSPGAVNAVSGCACAPASPDVCSCLFVLVAIFVCRRSREGEK